MQCVCHSLLLQCISIFLHVSVCPADSLLLPPFSALLCWLLSHFLQMKHWWRYSAIIWHTFPTFSWLRAVLITTQWVQDFNTAPVNEDLSAQNKAQETKAGQENKRHRSMRHDGDMTASECIHMTRLRMFPHSCHSARICFLIPAYTALSPSPVLVWSCLFLAVFVFFPCPLMSWSATCHSVTPRGQASVAI